MRCVLLLLLVAPTTHALRAAPRAVGLTPRPVVMCAGEEAPMKRLQQLEADLAAAVLGEKYDVAAALRDELAELRCEHHQQLARTLRGLLSASSVSA